jgi:hypothetical protein
MQRSAFSLLLWLALAGLAGPARALDPQTQAAAPAAAELAAANTATLLSSAREALGKLAQPPAGDGPGQPRIYFSAAAESLTALYQLHGCNWAVPELHRLYARADAPPLALGFSPDGRVLLRVEPLELKNPVFDGYTVLLCTFNSETARDIRDGGAGAVLLRLPDGSALSAQAVQAGHPLWPHLDKQARQFQPLRSLPSGAGIVFKQLYAIPRRDLRFNACAVSLDWGGYHFVLPRWTGAGTEQEAGSG